MSGVSRVLVKILNIGKVVVAVFWIVWALSLTSMVPDTYGTTIIWIGALILVAHLFEYFLIRSRFAGQGGGRIDFVQTIVFGMAHWLPLIRRPNRRNDNG
jgi:uncharacterized protein YhhL (DUF1145 family)